MCPSSQYRYQLFPSAQLSLYRVLPGFFFFFATRYWSVVSACEKKTFFSVECSIRVRWAEPNSSLVSLPRNVFYFYFFLLEMKMEATDMKRGRTAATIILGLCRIFFSFLFFSFYLWHCTRNRSLGKNLKKKKRERGVVAHMFSVGRFEPRSCQETGYPNWARCSGRSKMATRNRTEPFNRQKKKQLPKKPPCRPYARHIWPHCFWCCRHKKKHDGRTKKKNSNETKAAILIDLLVLLSVPRRPVFHQ